ncbi:MAG: ComF family protein [Candidatus Azobacteroides sp.]|nr:ComF family protein [Candidatus Azobacteroides sp.]
MKDLLKDFAAILFPELCITCNAKLIADEKFICMSCLYHLPETKSYLQKENQAEKRFWGKFDIVHAHSFFRYVKDSDFHRLLVELKYKECKELGEYLGDYYAGKLKQAGVFEDVDYIVPVPLHRKRHKKRGYNQSEWIAKGMSKVLGKTLIPDNLYRKSANSTQTKRGVYERWENVAGIFELKNPMVFADKHLLLVDDVLTTGSTITACAHALHAAENVRISVATLAIA